MKINFKKILKNAAITIVVLYALAFLAVMVIKNNVSSSEEEARKICSLASIGMNYSDFEKLLLEKGFDRKPSPSVNDGESVYLFLFYNMNFSSASCKVHVKDNLIVKKESSLDKKSGT